MGIFVCLFYWYFLDENTILLFKFRSIIYPCKYEKCKEICLEDWKVLEFIVYNFFLCSPVLIVLKKQYIGESDSTKLKVQYPDAKNYDTNRRFHKWKLKLILSYMSK